MCRNETEKHLSIILTQFSYAVLRRFSLAQNPVNDVHWEGPEEPERQIARSFIFSTHFLISPSITIDNCRSGDKNYEWKKVRLDSISWEFPYNSHGQGNEIWERTLLICI